VGDEREGSQVLIDPNLYNCVSMWVRQVENLPISTLQVEE